MLVFVILNGMITPRFLLKFLAPNPASPFAQSIDFCTAPFQGLLYTPIFGGAQVKFQPGSQTNSQTGR